MTRKLIDQAKQLALQGVLFDRELIIKLLNIDTNSSDCDYLGKAAREVASVITDNRAYIWSAIGIDFKPCPMNCDYCSLGEQWGIVTKPFELTDDEVIEKVRTYAQQGVRWIVFRTTEFYSLDKIIDLVKRIRKEVKGNYELGLNAGEFNGEKAKKMEEASISFIYHSLRLREGINTKFTIQERLNTLSAIQQSNLTLVNLVEPLGIEHTNEEIADNFLNAMRYGAKVTGCMERVPVKGTPLGDLEKISERKLAHVIAVTRLAANYHAPDICVHQCSKLAMQWGANVTVVEIGSNPRDTTYNKEHDWQDFNVKKAKEWFKETGYQVFQEKKS